MLHDSLGGITQFVVDDSTGKITGYKTEIGGADTVFPFSGGTVRNEILYDDIIFDAINSAQASYITKENGTIYYSYGANSWTGMQAELDLTDVKYVIYSCVHGWSSYGKNGLSSTKPSSSITDVSGMVFTNKNVNKLHILDVSNLTGTYYFYARGRVYNALGDTDGTFYLNYFGLIKDDVDVSNFHLEGVL